MPFDRTRGVDLVSRTVGVSAVAVALAGCALVVAATKGIVPLVIAQALAPGTTRDLAAFGAGALGLSALLSVASEAWESRRGRSVELGPLDGNTPRAIVASLRTTLAAAGDGEGTAVVLLDRLLEGASLAHASDIHLTPEPHGLDVSLRLDGQVTPVGVLSKQLGRALQNRIKILSQLRIEGRQGAQDGRLKRTLAATGLLEIRVSAIPTTLGDRIVLRVLEDSEALPRLDELGFEDRLLRDLKRLLAQPQGLLFVTGPVGSGKSTTLYSCLLDIHKRAAGAQAIMTLEDPIERRLGFLAQSQVDRSVGHSFAQGLRSLLRQDPNVLMVGEIRDDETAQVALQAGQSGHLILTTIHAPGTQQVFPRLVQMGLSSERLLDATLGVLSQRLVRRLCKQCRTARAKPAAEDATALLGLGVPLPSGSYFGSCGCAACDYTGFDGRIPLGELLVVTSTMRERVRAGVPIAEIGSGERALPALLLSGLAQAAAGETTVAEVLEATGHRA